MGFITALEEKFEEQKRTNQEWGLVLMKDSQVIEEYEEFEKGFEDGSKFSISDKITEGEDEEVFSIASGSGAIEI